MERDDGKRETVVNVIQRETAEHDIHRETVDGPVPVVVVSSRGLSCRRPRTSTGRSKSPRTPAQSKDGDLRLARGIKSRVRK